MKSFLISISRIILGIVIILITYAILVFGLFDNFLFQPIFLVWVHVLSFSIGFYLAGLVNRKTNPQYLLLLYLTLTVAIILEVFYFPIIAYLVIFPTLALIISRNEVNPTIRKYSKIGLTTAFVILFFSQPLTIKLKGFGTTLDNTPFNVISTGNFFNNKPPQVKREDFLDVYENLINMDQFKGKNLYITFWATWCGPCIGEQPKLEELKAEFADNDDIIFVDISLDKDHEKWLAHVTKTQPKGIQLISKSTGKTRANFNVSSTPHHVVVNQDGYYRSIAKPRFIKNEMLLNSYSIDKHVMN